MLDKPRHKTAVIIGTLSHVPSYPKKLKMYLNNASPYWQAVYWDKGKTYRRSLKTTDKLEAYEHAKAFYEQIIVAKYTHQSHLAAYPKVNQSKAITVKAKFSLKYVAEQWIGRMTYQWSYKHQREVERQLNKNIYPFLANKQINAITKPQLLAVLQKIEERGALAHTRRVLSVCQQIWRYAILIDACKQDITVGLIKALHRPNPTKHQSAVEVNELPKLMLDIAAYSREGDLMTRYALQLIALTFVRKNELVLAKWEEFDLESCLWRIPAERMKMRIEHVVPLSSQAFAILQYLKAHFPSDCYVLHKQHANKTLFVNDLINALYRLGYKSKMSVHGFRAIASTVLNEQGFRADVIERQLAHVEQNQSRRAYNRAHYLNERIEMMNWWGNYLEKNGLNGRLYDTVEKP